MEISWDDFQVRILVIAPTILRSTLDIVDKINYLVDLIEVRRWVDGDNNLLLVTKLEPELKTKTKHVSGLPIYNDEFYLSHYNKQSAKEFINYAQQVDQLVKQKDWNLELKFNKRYCGFRAGFFNAFGVHWISARTFAFFIKLPESDCAKYSKLKVTRYQKRFKQALYYITPGETKVEDFVPLFEKAYQHLTGK